jgi:D-threo-aldose 1-dehydrogenase
MSRTVLPGTEVETSRLGFGCAVLGGRLSTRAKRRLLDAAFDAGVTHFDVARLYGHGEAERHLGAFLRQHRDSVTVTTKAGLRPTGGLARFRLVRAGRHFVGSPSDVTRAFCADDIRSSLQTSLRKLGTDHVDLLLLHECRPEDVTADVIATLDDCVQRGLARATGIATGLAATTALLEREASFPAVIQVSSSVLAGDAKPPRAAIVHSVLARDLARMRALLAGDGVGTKGFPEAAGVDPSDDARIARFVLACALDVSDNQIVLFSSRHPEHVRSNAAALLQPALTPELRATLAALRVEANEGVDARGFG